MALVTIPLLFGITFFNIQTIIQTNTLDLYAMIYFMYLIVSWIGLVMLKYLKIKNPNIKRELTSSLQFMLYSSLLAIPGIILVHAFFLAHVGQADLVIRGYGRVAFFYLVLALCISPLLTRVKNRKVSDMLTLFRKILWILSFLFFMRHGLEYFGMELNFAAKHIPAISNWEYIKQNLVARMDASTGVLAWIFMFILWITSNTFSVKLLTWWVWKKIQSLVYPVFLISCIHVAFASRFESFYVVLIILLVTIRTAAYLSRKSTVISQSWTTTKYLCVPCGYIYDEALGDPDGGIQPWTKFEDIPDGRVCPVCWVGKSDFEPYYDTAKPVIVDEWFTSKVVKYVMLTKDVLELSLQIDTPLTILPGQYVMLVLKDFDGEFTRAYSVVDYVWNTLILWIKLKDTGRAGRQFKKIKVWDTIKVKKILWNFVLKTTSNPKVFIGTGAGLSPLYSMIAHNSYSENNMLLWWVRAKEDLFYVEQLQQFKNLKTEFFLSREEHPEPYHLGRVSAANYEFAPETEFYLCGNAPMVKEQMASLKARGFKNIYLETF